MRTPTARELTHWTLRGCLCRGCIMLVIFLAAWVPWVFDPNDAYRVIAMWWAGLGFLIIGWGLGFQPVVITWLVYWNLVGFPWETAEETEERAKRRLGWYLLDWERDWER